MVQRIEDGLGAKIAGWVHREDGNVTVDWIVVIAGVLAFALVVLATISGGVIIFSERADAELSSRETGTF